MSLPKGHPFLRPAYFTLIDPPAMRPDGDHPWHDTLGVDHEGKLERYRDPRQATRVLAAVMQQECAVVLAWVGEHPSKEGDETVHYTADFVIFETSVVWESQEGRPLSVLDYKLNQENGHSNASPTNDVGEAEWIAAGTIKWDGCVNFRWPDGGRGLQHRCGWDDIVADTRKWAVAYELCDRLMQPVVLDGSVRSDIAIEETVEEANLRRWPPPPPATTVRGFRYYDVFRNGDADAAAGGDAFKFLGRFEVKKDD